MAFGFYNNMQNYNYWKNRKASDPKLDWNGEQKSWLDGYVRSVNHPHRDAIIKELKKLKFDSLLEIGCNTGANLIKIRDHIGDIDLAGIDANIEAVKIARYFLPEFANEILVGNIERKLPFKNKSYDVVLLDAVLMYVSPEKIMFTIQEITRVAKKTIVIIDWYSKSSYFGSVLDFHWTRNYEQIFKSFHYKLRKVKITKKIWPDSKTWQKNGYIFIAQLQ